MLWLLPLEEHLKNNSINIFFAENLIDPQEKESITRLCTLDFSNNNPRPPLQIKSETCPRMIRY